MLVIPSTLGDETITFYAVESIADYTAVKHFVRTHKWLGIDTESTGINCYKPGWKLRTLQIGNATTSYVIPAEHRTLIVWITRQYVHWIGHNGTHDWRCIDCYLGYTSGNYCDGETYIPAHYLDSRNRMEGGTGHKLKELAIAHISSDAGKWEDELKATFKTIEIPIPGEVYKSGPRKGKQKVRKAKLSEGWAIIDVNHPAYTAYAASDPVLTYRVWEFLQPTVKRLQELYRFDMAVDRACDALQRRAMRLDVTYTNRLSGAFDRAADRAEHIARKFGCNNINSTAQVTETLISLGAHLTVKTPTGKLQCNDVILRKIANGTDAPAQFAKAVLTAKQIRKRQTAYTASFLEEMDEDNRIHPSINSLAARTARMSVSNPPLQQLPTKDRETELNETNTPGQYL